MTIEMLCFIELGRRRVISGRSRDIGYLVILNVWNIELGKKKRIWRPGGGKLAPSVSVKDRSLPGPVIEFELY